MRRLLFHLPLLGFLLIVGVFGALEAGMVQGLRNERTYAWFVVVWAPLGALLALTQVCLWIGWAVRRVRRR